MFYNIEGITFINLNETILSINNYLNIKTNIAITIEKFFHNMIYYWARPLGLYLT